MTTRLRESTYMTSYLLDSQPIDASLTGAIAYPIRHRSYDLKGRPTESTRSGNRPDLIASQ
jgi:hypothetical protein